MEDNKVEETPAGAEIGPASLEAIQQGLAEEKARAERYLSNWQRAQADLINYQKMVERDKSDLVDYTRNQVILSVLPVVDDFEYAIASIPSNVTDHKWTEGVKLIYKKLQSFLESQGVLPIDTKSQAFDPRYHEAVMKGEGQENMVVQELRRGYKIKDTVLRPSLVVVGGGRQASSNTATGTGPETTPRREHRKHEKDTTRKRDNQEVEKGG